MNTPDTSALRGRRRFGTLLLASGAALALAGKAVQAQSLTSVAGVWHLDGNHHTTTLNLVQHGDGSLTGSMYGEAISGWFSPAQATVVLLRGPATRPTQVFIGTLSQGGALIAGSLYALTVGMGASQTRNRYFFTATRQPGGQGAATPGAETPSFDCLAPNFTVFNRPAEFPAWTFPLQFDSPGFLACIAGEFTGNISGQPIYGHYASGSGRLVFMRMAGSVPAQFYVGFASQVVFQQRLSGLFYALTAGMGAGLARVEYDWRAQS